MIVRMKNSGRVLAAAVLTCCAVGFVALVLAVLASPFAKAEPSPANANLYSYSRTGTVKAMYRLTIDTTSRLLIDPNVNAAGSAMVPDGLAAFGIVREDGTTGQIRCEMGATASATTSPEWPAAGVGTMTMTVADLKALRVISSSGTIYATLIVMEQ